MQQSHRKAEEATQGRLTYFLTLDLHPSQANPRLMTGPGDVSEPHCSRPNDSHTLRDGVRLKGDALCSLIEFFQTERWHCPGNRIPRTCLLLIDIVRICIVSPVSPAPPASEFLCPDAGLTAISVVSCTLRLLLLSDLPDCRRQNFSQHRTIESRPPDH